MRISDLVWAAPGGLGRVVDILDNVRNALVIVLTALAIAALTYAGIRYVIAGGDPGSVEKAKTAAKSAVVGLGLALLAPILVAIVKGIVGG
jgi:Type IV secretion system pilin